MYHSNILILIINELIMFLLVFDVKIIGGKDMQRYMKIVKKIFLIGYILFLSTCQNYTADTGQPKRSYVGTRESRKVAKGKKYMIAAANPQAVAIGEEILTKGGNAIDVMVAIQLVLTIVEPESSGIGGGAFLVYYDNKKKTYITLDGRETAPQAADEKLFFRNGKKITREDAITGGLAVGAPGTLKLMEKAHKRYGTLPWKDVIQPVIDLAKSGFVVTDKLHKSIVEKKSDIKKNKNARNFFMPNGKALQAGSIVQNLEFAKTLAMIQEEGSDVFYKGIIGTHIADAVRQASQPGYLTKKDIEDYKVIERTPLCFSYRKQYKICGIDAPGSGTITVGQILGILENFNLKDMDYNSPEFLRLFGEASRLAYADRDLYIADPAFFNTPSKILLKKKYLLSRAKLIPASTDKKKILTNDEVVAGDLSMFGYTAKNLTSGFSFELPSTSHMAIIDTHGNIVSLTTTIEDVLGSKIFVDGFILNNELTDFSFAYEKNGKKIANRVEGGKRPRSSMAPVIVFKNGSPYIAIGSPGGSRIIQYVARTLIATLDWGYNIQDAINQPNIVSHKGTYELEKDTKIVELEDELIAMGYKTKVRDIISGLHGIAIIKKGLIEGGADPRREGVAIGK